MGGWIRRGWFSLFWGTPIFRPEAPKPFKMSVLRPLDWRSGRPKKAKINHDGSNPPFSQGKTKGQQLKGKIVS